MPLSREEYEKIKVGLADLACAQLNTFQAWDEKRIKHESILWLLEKHLECDVQNVQGDPNTSTGRDPKFVIDKKFTDEELEKLHNEWLKSGILVAHNSLTVERVKGMIEGNIKRLDGLIEKDFGKYLDSYQEQKGALEQLLQEISEAENEKERV